MLRFSGSYLREHRDEDERIRGRFLTGYVTTPISNDDVSGIRGIGVAFGIYGATRLENDLIAEHYLGLGFGLNDYELSFGAVDPIIATGSFGYGAIYGGLAVSGDMTSGDTMIALRAGVDLAFAIPEAGTVMARRGSSVERGGIDLHDIGVLRLFTEAEFTRSLTDENADRVAVTPGIFCDSVFGRDTGSNCGFSLGLDLLYQDEGQGEYGLELDAEITEAGGSAGVSLNRIWYFDTRAGASQVGVSMLSRGTVSANYSLNWDF
jgi:hypothetical protein